MYPNEKMMQESPADSQPGEGNLMAVQERLGLFTESRIEERILAALEEKPLALV